MDDHPEHGRKRLWDAFARSVRNNVLAEFTVQFFRIGGIVVLARALRPEYFGVLKILVVSGGFSVLLCEAGIPDALVQRKELRSDHEATAWWLMLGLAASVACGLYFLAPLVAGFMAMPDLRFGMRLLCIPILLEGTSNVANARLQRKMRFDVIALADVLGEIGFIATAFLLLWLGYARWCLAGGLAVRFTLHGLTIWTADPEIPHGAPSVNAMRDLGRFAISVCGGRVIVVASGNADYLMVGRLLGSRMLGFYSIAWDLLRFIPDRLYRVAGRVAFTTFAKLQDDNKELASGYYNFVAYIGRFILPMAGCAAIAAPELIGSIFGRQWLQAAEPLRLLSLGLALLGLRIGIGSIYYAKDYPSFDIYLNGIRLVLLVILVYLASKAGLVAVSASMSVLEGLIAVAGQYLVCGLIDIRLRDLAPAALPGLKIALVCMLATAAGKALGNWLGIGSPLILPFVILPPAIAFCWLEANELTQMMGAAFKRTDAEMAQS